MYKILFETPRLIVRHLEKSDLEAFHEMQGNPNVLKYTGGGAKSLEENEEELQQLIQHYEDGHYDFQIWAVVRKEEAQFIGTAAIVANEAGHEIGYRFSERFWGNGYGKEISDALIQYAFEKAKLPVIVAYVDVRNTASVKILDQSVLKFQKEYYNEEDKCMDRYYRLEK